MTSAAEVRRSATYKLLIVDELGFVPLSKTGAELLFEVFSQRYERGSTLVTTNLPSTNGPRCSARRLTGALLDRLTHHVNILEMNGDIQAQRAAGVKPRLLNRPPSPRLTPWAHRSLPRAPPRGDAASRVGARGQARSRQAVPSYTATGPFLLRH